VAVPSAQFVARRLAISLFWIALAFAFFGAIAPVDHRFVLADQDRIEHFKTFFVLTLLATAAYPGRALAVTGMALLAFGAFIEVVQAMPMIDRSGDLADLVADGVGILSAAALLSVTGARFKLLRLLRPTPAFVNSVHGR